VTGCARRSAAMAGRCRRCAPMTWPRSRSGRCWTAIPRSPPTRSTRCCWATPTRRGGQPQRRADGGLLAGLPVTVPGVTLNRLCASGMDAVGFAARGIRAGDYAVAIAGGVESMTRAPFVMPKPGAAWSRRDGCPRHDHRLALRQSGDGEAYGTDSMPQTADNVAEDFGISRADQDAFALRSQERWAQGRCGRRLRRRDRAGDHPPAQGRADRRGPRRTSEARHHRRGAGQAARHQRGRS
jgi:hypothetical protein